MNARQVALLAGCSKSTVKRDAQSGKITTAHKDPGALGQYLFTQHAAQVYIEARL
jgi:hypothetical protein